MRFMVCLKPVPEPGTVRVDPETHTLKRESATLILNPADRYALEAAVELKEKTGAEVVAVMMGPPNAAPLLKEAYACGADEVYLLSDRAFAGADTLATSYVLSLAAQKLGAFDLIFCGKVSIDGETAQVGPELAAWLDWPSVIWVKELSPVEGGFEVVRVTDEGEERLVAKTPILFTIEPESNDPRPPSVKRLLEMLEKDVPTLTAEDLGADPARLGLEGSPTRVLDVFTPTYEGKKELLEGAAEEVVEKLVSILKERGLI
ncbi:MAG: electron transfer flavoprotein subunit beta/FixA family protein [Thermodesulfobacteria bacterium]|nr:electron transfer flavoprotein subunit beta/FixA family protein [Thermodesulfobacteriota bacterium]